MSQVGELVAYYIAAHTLAENVRYAHEYGSTDFDGAPSSTVQTSKNMFESKLAQADGHLSAVNGEDKKTSNHRGEDDSDAKDLFERRY